MRELLIAACFAAVGIGLAVYKAQVLGYRIVEVEAESGYQVELNISVEAFDKDVRISTFLPLQTTRQRIRKEEEASPDFEFTITPEREAIWEAKALKGVHEINYSFFAQTERKTYELPQGTLESPAASEKLAGLIEATDKIQADEDDIVAKAWELMPNGISYQEGIRNLFDFVYKDIKYQEIRGATDALTAFRLQQASCNGKNRLLIALCRARGIPARFVKGLILENTSKRTTHAWSEIYLGGEWIPFCPTNGYFAEIPEHYLELAKVDSSLFRRSSSIGFDWEFVVSPKVKGLEEAVRSNAKNPLNFLNHWVSSDNRGISIHLMMVILLIPIAASVVSFSRTVIGLHTFGTFMPSLIAVSFIMTGYWAGSLFFMSIMIMTGLLNLMLFKIRILHLPRLVIILTFVVMVVMVTSAFATQLGVPGAASISLFPIAILSLTSERFSQTIEEDGWGHALMRTLVTYLVSAGCYFVISSRELQLLVAAFPELLLVNIAFNLLIGSWHGIRVSEFIRFRVLYRKERADV